MPNPEEGSSPDSSIMPSPNRIRTGKNTLYKVQTVPHSKLRSLTNDRAPFEWFLPASVDYIAGFLLNIPPTFSGYTAARHIAEHYQLLLDPLHSSIAT